MTKYNIVFIPNDPEFEIRIIKQYNSYEDAAKEIEMVEDMKIKKEIICFIHRKDGNGVEWVNNMEGKIKIQRNERYSGCNII